MKNAAVYRACLCLWGFDLCFLNAFGRFCAAVWIAPPRRKFDCGIINIECKSAVKYGKGVIGIYRVFSLALMGRYGYYVNH